MVKCCSVFGCKNRFGKENISFYRIPAIVNVNNIVDYKLKSTNSNETTYTLTKQRREKWIAALKLGSLTDKSLKNFRVCSDHFINRKPAELIDTLSPDWVPSQNLGYSFPTARKKKSSFDRHARFLKRQKTDSVNEVEKNKDVSKTSLSGKTDLNDAFDTNSAKCEDATILYFKQPNSCEINLKEKHEKQNSKQVNLNPFVNPKKSICVVDGCINPSRFSFPKNEELRKKWLEAIRKPNYNPKSHHKLCECHFTEKDFPSTIYSQVYKPVNLNLHRGSVPSIFPWNLGTDKSKNLNNAGTIIDWTFNVAEETVYSSDDVITKDSDFNNVLIIKGPDFNLENKTVVEKENIVSKDTDTNNIQRYKIADFKNNALGVLEFTGLENYEKFMTVFYSLGPKKYFLKYKGHAATGNLSLEDQFFLTLWKLRKNCNDSELGYHFGISKVAVGNVFNTWIDFMAKQWSKIDIWPCEEVVQYYMPENFKKDSPSSGEKIDSTKIKIDQSTIFVKDKELSKYQIYTERIIGLLKTYKIMTSQLHYSYLCKASEIFGICVMLCNFKDCITNDKNQNFE